MAIFDQATIKQFESKFIPEPNSGCWLWTGIVIARGYGLFWAASNKKMMLAHRVSWRIYRRLPIGDLCVLHKCDVRCCVNPDHLFLGTNADNSADMRMKGRSGRGERNSQAKLTPDIVEMIRRAPGSQRQVARQFGISQSTVSDLRRGKRWPHAK